MLYCLRIIMFYTRLNVSQRLFVKYTYMANVFSINTFTRKDNKIKKN